MNNYTKIICSVNSHFLASNSSTNLHFYFVFFDFIFFHLQCLVYSVLQYYNICVCHLLIKRYHHHMDNAWLKMMLEMSTASLYTSWQTTTPLTTHESLPSQWCHHWAQHCQVRKKIFSYPRAGLVHCDGACQKLRNQMQNYLKYMNKTFFRATQFTIFEHKCFTR